MILAVTTLVSAIVGLFTFGAAACAVVAPLQLRVMNKAGDVPDVASAANISAFTLGSAIGIYLGGAAIDGGPRPDVGELGRWADDDVGPASGDGLGGPSVDSYGIELELANLARTPDVATSDVMVTAANGESLTFEATPMASASPKAPSSGMGRIRPGWMPALGPPPFTYDVVVTLDGIEYAATAKWPADQIVGNESSVAFGVLTATAGTPMTGFAGSTS